MTDEPQPTGEPCLRCRTELQSLGETTGFLLTRELAADGPRGCKKAPDIFAIPALE